MKKIIMAGLLLTCMNLNLNAKEIVLLQGPGGGETVKFLLKGKDGSSCTGIMDCVGEVDNTNCVRMTNAKKSKVLCTKKKNGLCKTQNEVLQELMKQVNS